MRVLCVRGRRVTPPPTARFCQLFPLLPLSFLFFIPPYNLKMVNGNSKDPALKAPVSLPLEARLLTQTRNESSTRSKRSVRSSSPPKSPSDSVALTMGESPAITAGESLREIIARERASRNDRSSASTHRASVVAPANPGGTQPTHVASPGFASFSNAPLNAFGSIRMSLAGAPPPPIKRPTRETKPQAESEAQPPPEHADSPFYSSQFKPLRTTKLAFVNGDDIPPGLSTNRSAPKTKEVVAVSLGTSSVVGGFTHAGARGAGPSNLSSSSSRRVISSRAPSASPEFEESADKGAESGPEIDDSDDEDGSDDEYQDEGEDESEEEDEGEGDDEEADEEGEEEENDVGEGGSTRAVTKGNGKGKNKGNDISTTKGRVLKGRPSAEEAVVLSHRFSSPQSFNALTEYVQNHSNEPFDPDEAFDLILPHPYLRSIVNGDFPFPAEGIHLAWGPHFARLRQFATLLLNNSGPNRLNGVASRLRKAVRRLGPNPPAEHKDTCASCFRNKTSCLDIGSGPCFDCCTRGNTRARACQNRKDAKHYRGKENLKGKKHLNGSKAIIAETSATTTEENTDGAAGEVATPESAVRSVQAEPEPTAVDDEYAILLSYLRRHMITDEKDTQRKANAKFLLKRLPAPDGATARAPVAQDEDRILVDHFLRLHMVGDEKDEKRKGEAELLLEWLLALPSGTKVTGKGGYVS